MRALGLAQVDAAPGKLSREKQVGVRDTIEEVVEDLSDYADERKTQNREHRPTS